MAGLSPIQQQVQGTGSWNLDVPISFFASATYRTPDGKVVQLPVQVAGDKFTSAYQETARPQS